MFLLKKKIKILLFSIFVHFFKILSQKFLTLRQKKKKKKKRFPKCSIKKFISKNVFKIAPSKNTFPKQLPQKKYISKMYFQNSSPQKIHFQKTLTS